MRKRFILGLLMCVIASAQSQDALREVLDRLARLEEQNRALTREVEELKARLSPREAAPIEERVDVAEQRVAELDQTRVSSENKFPVTLSGMILFNAFTNGQSSAGRQYPVVVPASGQAVGAGASMRQSIVGLKVEGPRVVGGGQVRGLLQMDFFGGDAGLAQTIRLRVARLDVDWKNTTAGFGFDKPIVAHRDPDSLAQVAVSPLTGAGNLWLWQPQARVEQRVGLGPNAGLRGQFAVYQTAELGSGVQEEYRANLGAVRPGYQGRGEFWMQRGARRVELGMGFHASATRVIGQTASSRIFTMDWLLRPASRITLTGTYFQGSNLGVIGGLRQGVNIVAGRAQTVHGKGGWAQLKFQLTQRMALNLFSGQEDDRNRELLRDGIAKNQAHGANVMYRWGPNVMTSFEASQVRTTYFGNTRINPHYDLAIAYLF